MSEGECSARRKNYRDTSMLYTHIYIAYWFTMSLFFQQEFSLRGSYYTKLKVKNDVQRKLS